MQISQISHDWSKFDLGIASKRAALLALKERCDELMDHTARLNRQAMTLANAQSKKRIEDVASSRLRSEMRHHKTQLRSLQCHCMKLRARLVAAYSRLTYRVLAEQARKTGAAFQRAWRAFADWLRGVSDED